MSPLVKCKGTFAEYIVANAEDMSLKPASLNHVQAASLPYVVCTAWSAIKKSGGVNEENAKGKRVLVLGASGGVGTYAVQLLKAWQAEVVATCSSDSIERIYGYNADLVLDYKDLNFQKELRSAGAFDLILDCAYMKEQDTSVLMQFLKTGAGARYVTLNGPLLRNNDSLGFPIGFLKSVCDFGSKNVQYQLDGGKMLTWGLFQPSRNALRQTAKLVDEQFVSSKLISTLPPISSTSFSSLSFLF